MAPTKKEKTKADLDYALHDYIDKREELEEDFESFTTGFSATVVKFALDELSEKWEYVVTAKMCFIGYQPEVSPNPTYQLMYSSQPTWVQYGAGDQLYQYGDGGQFYHR